MTALEQAVLAAIATGPRASGVNGMFDGDFGEDPGHSYQFKPGWVYQSLRARAARSLFGWAGGLWILFCLVFITGKLAAPGAMDQNIFLPRAGVVIGLLCGLRALLWAKVGLAAAIITEDARLGRSCLWCGRSSWTHPTPPALLSKEDNRAEFNRGHVAWLRRRLRLEAIHEWLVASGPATAKVAQDAGLALDGVGADPGGRQLVLPSKLAPGWIKPGEVITVDSGVEISLGPVLAPTLSWSMPDETDPYLVTITSSERGL